MREKKYDNNEQKKIRDMPRSVLKELIDLSIVHTPDISLAIALSAFAGLRPGEVFNITKGNTHLKTGIGTKYLNQELIRVSIQLNEYRLRDVYPEYILIFKEIYDLYLKYLSSIENDTISNSILVGIDGKELTYMRYLYRFKYLVRTHLVPELLRSDDKEKRDYAALLQERNITPSILRQWFIKELIIMGEGASQVAYWSGNKYIHSNIDI